MKRKLRIAFVLISVVNMLAVYSHGQAWPKKQGAYVSKSRAGIPTFPKTLGGFRSRSGKDFWGKPVETIGTIRVFGGNGWEGIFEFPNTMNHCSAGVFMIRWRTSYPNAGLRSTVAYNAETAPSGKAGSYGYMYGTNCEQPMFRITDNSFVDVYYEIKFWQAAP